MPARVDPLRLNPFTDKRCKLLPCQKEMVVYWHRLGHSQRSLARMFKVDRRTIQFIIDPEKLSKNKERRQERGGWEQYYVKEKHTQAMRKHRKHKEEVYPIKP